MSLLTAALFWIGLAIAVAVASVLACVGGYLYGRLARGFTDETAARFTNVVAVGAAVIAAIAIWVVVNAGGGVDGTLVPDHELGANVVAAVVAGVAGGFVGTGAITGILRGHPTLPGVDDPSATRRQYTRYLTALFLVTFALATVLLPALRGGPLALVLVIVLAVLGLWALAPAVSLLTSATREPDEDESTRLEGLLERAAVDVRGVRVVDGDGRVSLDLAGAPGGRYLFVSAGALEALEDETLAAMLVARREQAARLEALATMAPTVGALIVLVVTALTDVSLVLGVVGAAVLVVAGFAGTRRLRYYTDARAADAVGPDRLADAFERAAEAADLEIATSDGWQLLASRPSLGARIERLRTIASDSSHSSL